MKKRICFVLAAFHLIALAVCTYIAAIEIETILVTGWICSATGIVSGIAARVAKQQLLAVIQFLTPVLAATLYLLESNFLHLGPEDAALPFCVAFVANQLLTTIATLVQLNRTADSQVRSKMQLSIQSMLFCTLSCSVFFAATRYLLEREHDVMMAIALALAGLTFVGLLLTLYNALVSSRSVV